MGLAGEKKMRRFGALRSHISLAGNRRKGRYQCNQDRYGGRMIDGSILELLFGQRRRSQSIGDKL